MLNRASLILACAPLAVTTMLCTAPGLEDESGEDDDETVEADPTESSSIRIEAVEFAREVDDEFNLVGGPVTSFHPDEPIAARIRVDGRPRSGRVTARWMWRDLSLSEVTLDLADVNAGVLFSVGSDTMIRVTFSPNLDDENSLNDQSYIGGSHRMVVLVDGEEVGSYPVRIVPPEGAIPTRFASAALFRAFDQAHGPSDPGTTFAPDQTVYLAGPATMGRLSWVDTVWTVNGQVRPELAQTIIARENANPLRFKFEAAPPGGAWPPGTHQILLRLDDADVGTYTFTVTAP